jgi:hypothetical protein
VKPSHYEQRHHRDKVLPTIATKYFPPSLQSTSHHRRCYHLDHPNNNQTICKTQLEEGLTSATHPSHFYRGRDDSLDCYSSKVLWYLKPGTHCWTPLGRLSNPLAPQSSHWRKRERERERGGFKKSKQDGPKRVGLQLLIYRLLLLDFTCFIHFFPFEPPAKKSQLIAPSAGHVSFL